MSSDDGALPMHRLAGMAGLVTGASRGIGAATTIELGRYGARVVACSRIADKSMLADGRSKGILPFVADVRDQRAMTQARDACLESFGRLDFLVANAGIVLEGELADADWGAVRDVIETNLVGVINSVHAVLPVMRSRRAGHIVIVSSVSGRETYGGQTVYIASKWGQVGFGKALRKEAMAYDVRVSLIEPGVVDTDMARSTPLGIDYLERTRSLRPVDVAREIAHILSSPAHVAINELVIQPRDQAI